MWVSAPYGALQGRVFWKVGSLLLACFELFIYMHSSASFFLVEINELVLVLKRNFEEVMSGRFVGSVETYQM
jgi:hypothetical protein